jgi:hypothetical protein
MDFLRGLRQSATLRSAVLQVFIDGHLGVQSPEDSSGSGEPASHPGAASADEMIRQAAESLSRLDEAGVARLEQHLWLQLERAERAAKAESLSLETAAEQAVWGALTAILMAGTTDAEPVVEPSPHRALVARGGPAVASSDGVLVLLRRLRALHTAPPSSRDDHGSVKFVLTEFASLLASVAEAGGSPYMEAFESVVDSGSAPIHSWNAQESDGESFAPPPPPSPQVVLPDQDPPRSAQPLMERMQDLFTGPDGKKPHPDKDGDLSIAFNSALIYLRAVEHDGEFPTVRLLSYIVREVERTPELLDILNQLNAHIPFGHCFFEPTASSCLATPVSNTTATQYSATCVSTCWGEGKNSGAFGCNNSGWSGGCKDLALPALVASTNNSGPKITLNGSRGGRMNSGGWVNFNLSGLATGDSCSVTVSGACSPGTFSGSALSQSFNSNATGSTNITCDNAITGANLTVALSCTC